MRQVLFEQFGPSQAVLLAARVLDSEGHTLAIAYEPVARVSRRSRLWDEVVENTFRAAVLIWAFVHEPGAKKVQFDPGRDRVQEVPVDENTPQTCWEMLSSPIFRVLDENGANAKNARVRILEAGVWLYADDVDGYKVLLDDEPESWKLEQVKDE